MKKFLIILLSLVLSVSMFAFAACSDTPADDDPQTGNEQTGDDGQDGIQPDGDDENAGDDTTEAQPPHTAGDPDIGKVAYPKFLEFLSICRDLFHGFDYSRFTTGTDLDRAKTISGGVNFIIARGKEKD